MAGTLLLLEVAIVGAILYGISRLFIRKGTGNRLPPGPTPLPLIGNIRDLPPKGAREWEHWAKHKELYGPISSLTVMGTTIIILNDADLAIELLEKRGQIHSARPPLAFSGDLVGWNRTIGPSSDMDWVRESRKRVHQVIGTKTALSKYQSMQEVEVHRFLLRTLQKPEDVISHLRTEAGAIILKLTYGYTVEPHKDDPLVDLTEKALLQFSRDSQQGAWMVDAIPAMKSLPEWLPGTGFHQVARERKELLDSAANLPMHLVKQLMSEKKQEECFMSNLYQKAGDGLAAEEEMKIKWSAASLYTGGADTSVSSMSTFFLAMMISHDVQVKAREEIDRVVGTHRLPGIEDRGKLPYINAVVKECFRWHPIAPLAIPHVSTQNDTCNGYFIPKGALLMPNIWLYTHDPDRYKDPMSFNPERFLADSPEQDPTDFVFGFGRRICPGRLLADSSVWLTVARSLAVFEIGKGVKDGKEIEPLVQFSPGIISHPLPFRATIRPRSAQHVDLIKAVEVDHPWEKSDADRLQSLRA